MDRTKCFTDILQTIRKNEKKLSKLLNNETKEDKNLLLRRKQMNEFNRNAKDLVKSITDMKNYLLQHRKDYINIYSPLLSLASLMTDGERDTIDEDVEKFIKICNETALNCLRADANRSNRSKSQLNEHQNNVIDLIQTYLKTVCDIHSQQKAIRIKRAIEKQRLTRLGHIVAKDGQTDSHSKQTSNHSDSKKQLNRKDNKENERPSEPKNGQRSGGQENNTTAIRSVATSVQNDTSDDSYQQLELNKHEMQAFEEENKHLFNQMNSLSDEVKNIELKVVEIARLQEIFTENVLKQEVDLNKLSDLTISSTENIRSGNQQLREAMKKNAGFRVWILFFITTLAFTILFLDWYND